MDLMTFLSNVINSLAWPGVIVVALIIFKRPITDLIIAIKNAKFKYKKGEISIEAELNTIHKIAPDLETKEIPEETKTVTAITPSALIDNSWKKLEQSATSAASISMPESHLHIADTLISRHILKPPEAEAFYKMSEIYNNLKESGFENFSDVSSASKYSSYANTLTKKIITVGGTLQAGDATVSGEIKVTPSTSNENNENNEKSKPNK